MKRVKKPVFFIVALLIIALTYTSLFGVYGQNGDFKETYIKGAGDIRWGIDIRGGVEATFSPAEDVQATDTQLEAAKAIIETRMVSQNITDYELYTDATNKPDHRPVPLAQRRDRLRPGGGHQRALRHRPAHLPGGHGVRDHRLCRGRQPGVQDSLPAPRRRTSSWRALTS